MFVVERISKTVEIEKNYMEIEQKGVKLRLTIVDTPGFNDSVNGDHWSANSQSCLWPHFSCGKNTKVLTW